MGTEDADQLARIATELEIKDLAIRYSAAVDDGDLAIVVDSFTRSGSFERAGQVVTGHEDLRTFFAAMADRYVLTRHLVEMHTIDPPHERERASGTVHGSAELVMGDTLFRAAYRYHDLYALEADRWRFASRQLRFIYYLPAAELDDAISSPDRVRIPGTDPKPSEHLG
jgi:hypothetical protein